VLHAVKERLDNLVCPNKSGKRMNGPKKTVTITEPRKSVLQNLQNRLKSSIGFHKEYTFFLYILQQDKGKIH